MDSLPSCLDKLQLLQDQHTNLVLLPGTRVGLNALKPELVGEHSGRAADIINLADFQHAQKLLQYFLLQQAHSELLFRT